MTRDEEHLNLLGIFHWVVGGLGLLFACFPLLHVGVGVMMLAQGESGAAGAPPAMAGWFFIVLGVLFALSGWGLAVCTVLSGTYLRQRRRRMFSFVTAAVLCAFMPFGTILGIFTIIVLSRESVQQRYQASATASSPTERVA